LLEANMLPDFVIIGAQKCGTTFLYWRLLTQHPHVEPAAGKEIHYFNVWKNYNKGGNWYRSHFSPPTWKEERRSLTGEASPYYVFHPHAARRIAELVPQVRLIVLLRNPVDRAYSHYQMQVRKGVETSTFGGAADLEEMRLRGERDKMLEDERYDSPNYRRFSYLSRGIYVDQLMEWSMFFSDDQMLVLKSEDLFERTPDTLKLVLNFLELPAWEPDAWKPREKQGKYPPMNPATRQQLCSYFEPHNQRLYEYLGVDFGW
jgi:Sulfotransferase domain